MFSAATKTGGGAASAVNYIDDVFSTFLYTGNGSTQTINNGIDLAGKGGLVWCKNRSLADTFHEWFDTARGAYMIGSNTTAAQTARSFSFGSNGFTIGSNNDSNINGDAQVSWTFRKAPKFFDVVTYTGDGSATRTLSHSLGSVPGTIIVKRTSTTGGWGVYHRSLGANKLLYLSDTGATLTDASVWGNTSPTSTEFTVGNGGLQLNTNGATYVAYLFAHNAGGFGATGTDNVISCGSFTTDSSGNATVNLGYEPQWILTKSSSSVNSWVLIDSMRGMTADRSDQRLDANTSGAESTLSPWVGPTATGFTFGNSGWNNSTFIYIAIRRSMKPPTTGTSVFQPVAYTGAGVPTTVNSSNQVDFYVAKRRGPTFSDNTIVQDRLRGSVPILVASDTRAEEQAYNTTFSRMTGIVYNVGDGAVNTSGATYVNWAFTRRTQFMDEVCYAGNASLRTINHNLGVVPELIIIKNRNLTWGWFSYAAPLGANDSIVLNSSDARNGWGYWNNTAPTSSVFTVVGGTKPVNDTGSNYVAYLFATLAGVSKVGSYTGTGTTQSINAGFTGGARFLLAKRTDASGAWFCWDSARGFTSSSSPYLRWNDGASVETTGDNGTYASTGGFTLTSSSPVNANGGTYIYLAIA